MDNRKGNKPGAVRPAYKGHDDDKCIQHSVSLTNNEKAVLVKMFGNLSTALRSLLPKSKKK